MSSREKKTVLRTIRITQKLDDLLNKDAQVKGIGVNALISTIMTKYTEWDRFTDKFGFISIAGGTFKSLLEAVDDEKLVDIAKELGSKMPKAVTLFWFKKMNLETFLKTISLFQTYSGLLTNEQEINESSCTITFHHNLGQKWSIFLRHFISQTVKNEFGIVPQAEASENSLVLSFHVNNQGYRQH